MPLFIGAHKLSRHNTEASIKRGWKEYRRSCKKMGLKPISSTFSLRKRVAYCLTQAKSTAQVRKAHQEVAIPLRNVFEVKTLR